jgi:hypothetical protein
LVSGPPEALFAVRLSFFDLAVNPRVAAQTSRQINQALIG